MGRDGSAGDDEAELLGLARSVRRLEQLQPEDLRRWAAARPDDDGVGTALGSDLAGTVIRLGLRVIGTVLASARTLCFVAAALGAADAVVLILPHLDRTAILLVGLVAVPVLALPASCSASAGSSPRSSTAIATSSTRR